MLYTVQFIYNNDIIVKWLIYGYIAFEAHTHTS